MLASSCGKDDDPLPAPEPPIDKPDPEPAPEPTPGEKTKAGWPRVLPDWSEALAEWTVPDSILIRFDEDTPRLYATATAIYGDSLLEGSHTAEAWNVPYYINVRTREAAVRTDGNGLLEAMPGYLFTASAEGEVTAGDTTDVSLAMRRRIAPVRVTLKFSEPFAVRDAECTLSGLISSIRLPEGDPLGKAGTALLNWKTLPDNRGIVLRLRTLGLYPKERQILTGRILLADGRTVSFESDITEHLAPLKELDPVELENTLSPEKPDEPDRPDEPWHPEPDPEAGFTATVEDWETIEGGELEAVKDI